MEYVVIVEQGETSFGAYVPDLPGCVAVGKNRDEAVQLIREAIEQAYFARAEGDQRRAALSRLLSLNAPVADWPQMEEEIIQGHLV